MTPGDVLREVVSNLFGLVLLVAAIVIGLKLLIDAIKRASK
jgi:hypothetical protein